MVYLARCTYPSSLLLPPVPDPIHTHESPASISRTPSPVPQRCQSYLEYVRTSLHNYFLSSVWFFLFLSLKVVGVGWGWGVS